MEYKLNEFIKYYNQNIHKDKYLTYLNVLLYSSLLLTQTAIGIFW